VPNLVELGDKLLKDSVQFDVILGDVAEAEWTHESSSFDVVEGKVLHKDVDSLEDILPKDLCVFADLKLTSVYVINKN
jgi:hypothetical protein